MKKLKYFYYRYLYMNPFYLWWKIGDKLKFKGNTYVEELNYLLKLKQETKLGEIINDTLSRNKSR